MLLWSSWHTLAQIRAKHEALRKAVKDEALRGCTFQPRLNSNLINGKPVEVRVQGAGAGSGQVECQTANPKHDVTLHPCVRVEWRFCERVRARSTLCTDQECVRVHAPLFLGGAMGPCHTQLQVGCVWQVHSHSRTATQPRS